MRRRKAQRSYHTLARYPINFLRLGSYHTPPSYTYRCRVCGANLRVSDYVGVELCVKHAEARWDWLLKGWQS